MNRIKNFPDFLKESSVSVALASTLSDILGGITGKSTGTPTNTAIPDATSGDSTQSSAGTSSNISLSASAEILKKTPGNDDYLIYLQHQQGPAGIKGIVKAMDGTGKLNPDTIKTKMCRGKLTKYANLMCNVPSDVDKNIRQSIIDDLDRGDQKSAAATFASIWKGKFNRKYEQGNRLINDPKYKNIREAIMTACVATGVPFDFAVAVAFIESGFNPNVGKNYRGLYALKPSQDYGTGIGKIGSQWSDPYVNAEKGVKLIAKDLQGLRNNLGSSWASLRMGDWTRKFVA